MVENQVLVIYARKQHERSENILRNRRAPRRFAPHCSRVPRDLFQHRAVNRDQIRPGEGRAEKRKIFSHGVLLMGRMCEVFCERPLSFRRKKGASRALHQRKPLFGAALSFLHGRGEALHGKDGFILLLPQPLPRPQAQAVSFGEGGGTLPFSKGRVPSGVPRRVTYTARRTRSGRNRPAWTGPGLQGRRARRHSQLRRSWCR